MRAGSSLPLCLFAVVLLSTGGCEVAKDPEGDEQQVNVTDFCLSEADLSMGIVEEHCEGYTGQQLTDIGGINGGYTAYVDVGVREFVFQIFDAPSGAEVQAYAMDFVTTAKARAMVDDREINGGGDKLPWTDPPFTALMTTSGGGSTYKVYACSGQWFFELQLQGMQNDDEARQKARQFLLTYQSKM